MTDLNIKNIKGLIPKKYSFYMLTMLLVSVWALSSCLKGDIFPAAGTPNDVISILDVRKIYKGKDVVLSKENMMGADKITGVVISDAASGNMPQGVFAMQQTSRTLKRGIEIYVEEDSEIPYQVGDSVTVVVEGATITKNKGALQIKVSSLSNITKIAENANAEASQLTLQELNNKFADYESTLIRIAHVDAAPGSILEGNVTLTESGGGKALLHTEPTAVFKGREVALNASYTAVARWNTDAAENDQKQLWLLNAQSIEAESGSIYPNFPETFETGDEAMFASGYSTKTGNLSTGNYTVQNIYIGNEANDLAVSGQRALRLVGSSATSSWLTMNYDLPNGATKVTVWAGSYGASADLGSTWRLEYSQNQGITWSQVGEDILTVSKVKQQFTFMMDIRGPVRFRIGKIGIGASTTNNQNGRFSMDDFAVYSNPEDGGPISDPIPEYTKLLGWQFGTPATAGNEVSIVSTTTESGLTQAVLQRGAGLAQAPLVRSFVSNAGGTVITSTKALALSQHVYYQVQFSVQPGYNLSLTAIDTKLRRSAAGARNHKWYYSLDGVTFRETVGTGDVNFEGTETEGTVIPTYYVYQTPELQNIPAGTTVTLRMYCWGFSNIGSGTFAIGRTPAGTATDVLSIGGQLTQ